MLIANNIEHTLDELGSDWEKLNKFVRDCVARLKGADTISIQTLQMQAFFMQDYSTFHDCSRKLRAALDERIDDTADQALFGRAASVTCPPEDPEAALMEIHRVVVGAPQPLFYNHSGDSTAMVYIIAFGSRGAMVSTEAEEVTTERDASHVWTFVPRACNAWLLQ
jgi:hypothetical protein